MAYSAIVMDHFLNPRNAGEMQAPDAVGCAGSPEEGGSIVVQLRIREGRVGEARFQAFGCGAAIAACSLLTEWVAGRTVEESRGVSGEQLVGLLGGLPADKVFCAEMAVAALQQALANWQSSAGREPG